VVAVAATVLVADAVAVVPLAMVVGIVADVVPLKRRKLI
jgi:hypothetical protein